MPTPLRRLLRPALLFLVFALSSLQPADAADDAATLVHLLGYIGVDYPETVVDGRVRDAAEYAEQGEFVGRVRALLVKLPDVAERVELLRQADELARRIARKAPGGEVTALTEQMRAAIVTAYRVTVVPRKLPDLAAGAQLYAEHCASCHGIDGRGDGPQARNLDPAPFDFHDPARQNQRSVHALYNVVTLGLDGTAMPAFAATLNDDERWALAFHVANLLATAAERERGAELWADDPVFRARFASLSAVTSATPAQISRELGPGGAKVLAYLRAHPHELMSQEPPLVFSARLLDQSHASYRAGKTEEAYALAVTAYLEGFELAETGLMAIRPGLKQDIERAMYDYRALIKAQAAETEVAAAKDRIQAQLATARELLDTATLGPAVAFTSSLVILLREGLEAILLLAVVVAFLIKTDRRYALKYIHIGWVTALLLGIATWVAAAYVVDISGASREVTEGVTALLAAAILLYVGLWLHNKLQARRWKEFIETKVQGAFEGGTLWGIALVAFIAVYREVFETVLFYQALWLQTGNGGQSMVVLGFVVAAVVLVVLSWLIFRFSVRLPLRLFFAINSVLLYALAVVFAGKGIAALQEAGKLPVTSIEFPTIDLLGIYPNLQALGLQVTLILAAVAVLVLSRRRPG